MKKNLTPTQKKKRYKTIQYSCFAGEFLSVLAPFITIGIVNYEEYFVQYDGTKMSIACALSACLMGLAVWLVAKKKFENSFITLIVGWASVAGIFTLMGQIINDIASIMWFGLIGILGAFGLDIASKKAQDKAKQVDEAIATANKEELVEQYKEEKKIKVKIRKG